MYYKFSFLKQKYIMLAFFVFALYSCSKNPQALYEKGNEAFARGNYYMAIDYYTKAVMLKNKFPEAITSRALAYEELGQKQKAIYEYEKAIYVDKDYLPAYNNLASMHIEAGNYKDAIYYLSEALKVKPDYYHALYSMGLCHYLMKNYDKALEYFKKAIDIKETDMAKYYLAMTYYALGDRLEALNLLDSINSESNDYLSFLKGKIKYELNDETAGNDFDNALKIKENHLYYYYRALNHFKYSNYENSISDAEKAISLTDNKNPLYLELMGDIYVKLGKKEIALNYYKNAYELDNNRKIYGKIVSIESSNKKEGVRKYGRKKGK